jgi:hypothetical protein
MKNLLVILSTMVLLTGCLDPEYKEDSSISKYTLDKYEDMLKKNNIDQFKCIPTKKGYRVYYFETKKPNDFPATIIVNGVNGTFNVLFDEEYKIIPKNNLLEDIDGCFKELDRIIKVDNSWK